MDRTIDEPAPHADTITLGPVGLVGSGSVGSAATVDEVLESLRLAAVRMIATASRLPVRLRLEVAGAAVEMSFPDPGHSPLPGPGYSLLPGPGYAPLREELVPAGLRHPERLLSAVGSDRALADVRPLAPEAGLHSICAPTVGVFYRAPEPSAAPFVSPGDTVVSGQQIGIVEAMKLMIPVEADRAGRIREILPENGASVEYGERLFTLLPEHG